MQQLDLKIHHIGFVTNSIEKSKEEFLKLGFTAQTDTILDELQSVYICFLENKNCLIELVEPMNEQSSINKTLKKTGVAPYHLCYEVDDIEKAFEDLTDNGFIPLFRPVPAKAINNRLICYLYKKEIGYFELINKQ